MNYRWALAVNLIYSLGREPSGSAGRLRVPGLPVAPLVVLVAAYEAKLGEDRAGWIQTLRSVGYRFG